MRFDLSVSDSYLVCSLVYTLVGDGRARGRVIPRLVPDYDGYHRIACTQTVKPSVPRNRPARQCHLSAPSPIFVCEYVRRHMFHLFGFTYDRWIGKFSFETVWLVAKSSLNVV